MTEPIEARLYVDKHAFDVLNDLVAQCEKQIADLEQSATAIEEKLANRLRFRAAGVRMAQSLIREARNRYGKSLQA